MKVTRRIKGETETTETLGSMVLDTALTKTKITGLEIIIGILSTRK